MTTLFGRRLSQIALKPIGPAAANAAPRREFRVNNFLGHVNLYFTPEEEALGFAQFEGFSPGERLEPRIGSIKHHGRWGSESGCPDELLDLGPVKTPEEAARLRRVMDRYKDTPWERTNTDAPNCVGAVSEVVAVHLGEPSIAPQGAYVNAENFMAALRDILARRKAERPQEPV